MNKKIGFKKWQKRMTFLSVFSLSALMAFTLSSCASINQELINQSISKGDSKNFAQGYDINKASKFALESNSSQNTYFDFNINELLLDWIDFLARKGDQITYKNLLDSQKKTIDNEFNSIIESSRKNNGADFELKFQQDELDPNGGNEENWKKRKLLEWARTEFTNKIFEKNYLAVVDSNNIALKSPTKSQIEDAIDPSNINSNKFSFSPSIIETNKINSYLDPIYANFQQFVYDKWVQIENPFIINMVLWKYGAPTSGINSVYIPTISASQPDEGGNIPPSTGNYNFPYFSNNATNDAWGTIDKFTNFVSGAKGNYISNQTYGLIDIPKQYTEDSSTYILAKNGSIYNDLYIEFAAAATYLLYSNKSGAGFPTITNDDANIQKSITTTSTLTDVITNNFVSSTSLNNRDIKISNSLLSEIINSKGEFKGLLSNNADAFITDAFKASNTELNKFMFLRNEAGVHAISIDGKTFIDKGTTIIDYKKNAGNIVLYRSLMNKYFGQEFEFSVDIQAELTNFFKANINWLVLEYYKANSNDNTLKMFRPNNIWGADKLNFLNLLNSYLFDLSKYYRPNDFQNKMYDAKAKFSSNYGTLTDENGLAAPWIYSYKTNSTNFSLMDSVTFNNPYSMNGSHKLYFDAISNFINSLNLLPLSSSFAGYKYSQYILANDFYINQALTSFGSDGDSFGSSIKIDILKNYLLEKVDNENLTFKNGIFNNVTSFSQDNLTNINNALVNNFYSSTFDSLTNKWLEYTSDSNNSIPYTNLNSYKKQLWLNSKQTKTSAVYNDYLSLYTLMTTVDYLLKDNGAEFLNYLKNKIILGEESYVAWYGNQNITLNTTASNVGTLINVSNTSLTKNINNTYKSSYFGETPIDTTAITNNTGYNSTYTNNNYYNYVAGSIGFSGLQTTSSNNATPVIGERLFSKQSENTTNTEGLLYTYGSSVNDLNTIIDNYTLSSDVDNLAKALQNKVKTISINDVLSTKDIIAKKAALKFITNNSSLITPTMFSPRTGYISSGALSNATAASIKDPDSLSLLHAAKVIQLNKNDISSLANLEIAISKLFTGNNITTSASDVFYNLVIKAATETSIQDQAISSIVTDTLKVDVYDIRLNNQLGPRWAKNWK